MDVLGERSNVRLVTMGIDEDPEAFNDMDAVLLYLGQSGDCS